MKLTLARAKELLAATTGDPHLVVHATNVRGCMEAFARSCVQAAALPCGARLEVEAIAVRPS